VAAAEKTPKPVNAKPATRKWGSKLPLIISAVAVLAAAGTGAGWYMASVKADQSAKAAAEAAKPKPRLPAPAQYLALDPPFVVNLSGGLEGPQYLQVEIQLMTRDAAALASLEQHSPAIRARLLMLLSQQSSASIADRPGKERLQAQALAEVQRLMRAETGKPAAEELLFTSFVTQ
jgi:flagellar FliL protein